MESTDVCYIVQCMQAINCCSGASSIHLVERTVQLVVNDKDEHKACQWWYSVFALVPKLE